MLSRLKGNYILALSVAPTNRHYTIEAERARRDFALFVKDAWHVIEPGTPLLWGPHMTAISSHLQAVSEGKIKRLLINIAPGHGKSSLISVLWPVWSWINDPQIRWLCASHSLDLAIRDNKNRRDLIESDWFQERYGHIFQLSSSQNVKGFFENNHRGYSISTATKASTTGKRGSCLLIDDPHNAMEGDVGRKEVIEWFGRAWASRLNDQENGAMVVVGQRIHSQDLSGHILELGGWEHLCLPEAYELKRSYSTSIGYDPRTVEGELLWPEKFPQEVLDTLKASLGSMNYASQYMQTPVASSGGQFREQWFRYCEEYSEAYILEQVNDIKSILKSQCWMFITVDLAISSKQTADFTVFACWAVTPTNDLILFDLIRGHFDNPEQLRQLKLLNARYRPDFFKIERVGYQLALIQQALAEGIPCKEYNPVRDKVSRASTPAIWMENGKIYFLKTLTHLHEIKTELLQFPRGAHDDIVDTMSIAADEVIVARIPLQGEDEIVVINREEEENKRKQQAKDQITVWQNDPFKYMDEHGWGGDD